MRIHVIGVSGTGMGPLAGLLASLGHTVSGSDRAFDPPIGPKLAQWGVECRAGYSPENLHLADPELRPDLVVVGNACRADHVEARAAIDAGLDYTHIGGALERFVLGGTRPLVVAGTHGKTTTSALCASLLMAVGREPGFLIGGVPHGLSASFRAPAAAAAAPFVIEGDEYDTAFFEKSPKLVHYQAQVGVLTSVEHDHVDIYPTPQAYREAFGLWLRGLSKTSVLVANGEDPAVVEVVRSDFPGEVLWYGVEPSAGAAALPAGGLHWVGRLLSAEGAEGSPKAPAVERFALRAEGRDVGVWSTPMMGRHNVSNCVAALAAVSAGYGVALDALREPLAVTQGVARRQEPLGSPAGVAVYDDFAHHPTAVRETLRALRRRHPQGALWAIFEPRSATACRKMHQAAYPGSFEAADRVILAPVGRELPEADRLDVGAIAQQLRDAGAVAWALPDVSAIVEKVVAEARAGDTVAILSNGAFGGIQSRLLEALRLRGESWQASPAEPPRQSQKG